MIKKKEQRATDEPKLLCLKEAGLSVCVGLFPLMRAAAGSCLDNLLKRAQRGGASQAPKGEGALCWGSDCPDRGAGGSAVLCFELLVQLHSEYKWEAILEEPSDAGPSLMWQTQPLSRQSGNSNAPRLQGTRLGPSLPGARLRTSPLSPEAPQPGPASALDGGVPSTEVPMKCDLPSKGFLPPQALFSKPPILVPGGKDLVKCGFRRCGGGIHLLQASPLVYSLVKSMFISAEKPLLGPGGYREAHLGEAR